MENYTASGSTLLRARLKPNSTVLNMSSDSTDTSALLEVARLAARAGAEAALRFYHDPHIHVSEKGGAFRPEPVTEADLASEEAVLATIRAHRPDDSFLTEESGSSLQGGAYTWVIDPIDATANFAAHRKEWAVSVAVRDSSGTTQASCVLAPALEEEYWAVRNGGSYLNGLRLLCPKAPVHGSVLELGAGRGARSLLGDVVAAALQVKMDVRRSGCASLGICRVASGVLGSMYAPDLFEWDTAAALLVASEAGASYAHIGPVLLVSNPEALDSLKAVIAPFFPL